MKPAIDADLASLAAKLDEMEWVVMRSLDVKRPVKAAFKPGFAAHGVADTVPRVGDSLFDRVAKLVRKR